jgi:hypothetical protein
MVGGAQFRAMVIMLPIAKVYRLLTCAESLDIAGIFVLNQCWRETADRGVQIRFIATLKTPFKF